MEWRAGRRSEDAVSPSVPRRSGATLRGLGGRGSSGEREGWNVREVVSCVDGSPRRGPAKGEWFLSHCLHGMLSL